jgi:hypothetical protein
MPNAGTDGADDRRGRRSGRGACLPVGLGLGRGFRQAAPGEAARMAGQMWMIPAQRASLHDDAANLLPRLGPGGLPGPADRGGAVAAGDRADPRPAGGGSWPMCAGPGSRGRGTWCRSPMPTEVGDAVGAFLDTSRRGPENARSPAEKRAVFHETRVSRFSARKTPSPSVAQLAIRASTSPASVFDQSQTSRHLTGVQGSPVSAVSPG